MIEMTTGIVCACMPGHGALFSRLLRRARALLGIATNTGNPPGHSWSNSGGGSGGARTPSVYPTGTPSSVTAVPRDGDILAKTHFEVRQTAVGERAGPWGSTVELTTLGEKTMDDDDDGFRGGQVVETKIWAGSIGRSKALGRSITLWRTRSKTEKSRRRASQPGKR